MTGLAKMDQVGTQIFTAFCCMVCVSQLGHTNDQHSKIMRVCGSLSLCIINSDIKNFQKLKNQSITEFIMLQWQIGFFQIYHSLGKIQR